MNGCCPGCGLKGSLEVFLTDAAHKQAFAEGLKLAKPIQEQLVAYLRLFAPPEKSLPGPRTLRLVRELAELVAAGDVVGLERQPPRPCPPRVWAEAMKTMVERKGGDQAHMKNHNYLRAVAWDQADKEGAKAERSSPGGRGALHAPDPDPAPGAPPAPGAAEPEISPEVAEANRQAFFAMAGRMSGRMSMPVGPNKAAKTSARELNLVPCGECAACQAGVPSACSDRRLP
jgi:hypothetical protein